MGSSKIFMVTRFSFKPLIYFELIFVYMKVIQFHYFAYVCPVFRTPFIFFYFFKFFNFYFYFILPYNTVLVLPYIDMNPPRVYMHSQTFLSLKELVNTLLSLIKMGKKFWSHHQHSNDVD